MDFPLAATDWELLFTPKKGNAEKNARFRARFNSIPQYRQYAVHAHDSARKKWDHKSAPVDNWYGN